MLSREEAEVFAIQVLAWLAADSGRLTGFLGATGASSATLRRDATEPAFMLAVLDYLMADEAQLLACCAALEVSPDQPAQARAALPGGDQWHWT